MTRMQAQWTDGAETGPATPATRTVNSDGGVRAFAFGEFRLDLLREHLIGAGGRWVLRRQAFATLRLLLAAAPALVTLDELLDGVWGRHALCPSAVPHVIVELRRALGDTARHPRYIETRHRRGYRMIPTVVRDLASPPSLDERRSDRSVAGHDEIDLLAVLDAAHESSAQTTPRQRLMRLYQDATERGLSFLARQVQVALQACRDETRAIGSDEGVPLPRIERRRLGVA